MRSPKGYYKIFLALGVVLVFAIYKVTNSERERPKRTETVDDVIEPASEKSLPRIAVDHSACPVVWSNPYHKDTGWKRFYLSLKKYKTFHKKQLKCLEAEKQNISSVCKESVRTLTWACTNTWHSSGIGDQFARIQMAFLLAIATNRVFTIYWDPVIERTMRYLQPNEINWQFYNERLGMNAHRHLKQHKLREPQDFDAFFSTLQQHITVNHELDVPFLRAYRAAESSELIRQALQPLGLLDILNPKLEAVPLPHLLGAILRYLFNFSSEVMEKVDHIDRSLGLTSKPYLAVHLRTGFYGTRFEEVGKFNPIKVLKNETKWTTLLECSIKSANSVLGLSSPIYLATDSYIVKQWAVREYGSRVRVANVTLQHVAMDISWEGNKRNSKNSGSIINTTTSPIVKKSKNFSAKKSTSSKVTGYEDTWVDFLLLARSRYLARSISGFSTAAGEFCSLPQSRQGCASALL